MRMTVKRWAPSLWISQKRSLPFIRVFPYCFDCLSVMRVSLRREKGLWLCHHCFRAPITSSRHMCKFRRAIGIEYFET